MEYITALLDMMKIREAETPIQPFDVKAGWSSFEKEYRGKHVDDIALLPKPSTPIVSREVSAPKKYRTRRLRRTVAIAIVLVLVIGAFTAQALGLNVFQVVAQWSEDIFVFRATEEDDNFPFENMDTPQVYSSLREGLEVFGVTQKVLPNWYPSGFTQSELSFHPQPDKVVLLAFYSDGDKSLSISITMHTRDWIDTMHVYEKDDSEVLKYVSSETTHYIISNNSRKTAIWVNDKLECSIGGDLTVNELQKMIDSIYIDLS